MERSHVLSGLEEWIFIVRCDSEFSRSTEYMGQMDQIGGFLWLRPGKCHLIRSLIGCLVNSVYPQRRLREGPRRSECGVWLWTPPRIKTLEPREMGLGRELSLCEVPQQYQKTCESRYYPFHLDADTVTYNMKFTYKGVFSPPSTLREVPDSKSTPLQG